MGASPGAVIVPYCRACPAAAALDPVVTLDRGSETFSRSSSVIFKAGLSSVLLIRALSGGKFFAWSSRFEGSRATLSTTRRSCRAVRRNNRVLLQQVLAGLNWVLQDH